MSCSVLRFSTSLWRLDKLQRKASSHVFSQYLSITEQSVFNKLSVSSLCIEKCVVYMAEMQFPKACRVKFDGDRG